MVRRMPARYWVTEARVPVILLDGITPPSAVHTGVDGLVSVDILVDDGRIGALEAPGVRAGPSLDQRGGIVLPCFVDMHTHIDKGHIWPRKPNPDGTFAAALEAATGWRLARIPGLLHEKDFFTLLSKRLFPSTDYIREKNELGYTPAPDCFHDMFGHMPMLTHPAVADFYQLFGQSALHAKGIQRTYLERLHWFTIEFGLIRQPNGLRVFGAGIISSKEEMSHALSDKVEVRDFSIESVIQQDYEVWHLQPILYALDSFDQLVDEFRHWSNRQGMAA